MIVCLILDSLYSKRLSASGVRDIAPRGVLPLDPARDKNWLKIKFKRKYLLLMLRFLIYMHKHEWNDVKFVLCNKCYDKNYGLDSTEMQLVVQFLWRLRRSIMIVRHQAKLFNASLQSRTKSPYLMIDRAIRSRFAAAGLLVELSLTVPSRTLLTKFVRSITTLRPRCTFNSAGRAQQIHARRDVLVFIWHGMDDMVHGEKKQHQSVMMHQL